MPTQPFEILYEDDEIFLINKPFGTAVQGGEGIAHPLDDEFSKQVGYRIHLVHRLDKDTSGILIIAKNSQSASKWIKLIAGPLVIKEYTAICIGVPLINGKECLKGKIKGTVEAHGREQVAETFFEVKKTCNVETLKLSLIRCTLGTGRMHQLRIQLAKSSAPIAQDDQHGNFKLNKILRKQGIKKLQLASTQLTIPIKGKQTQFNIQLPLHMQNTMNQFFLD